MFEENQTETKTTRRIYVACLASYNAGKLYGAWIDATQDADDIREKIAEMLAKSPEPGAKEWAVHDSEGLDPWKHGEWPDLEEVSRVAQFLEEHDDAAKAALGNFHDVDEAVSAVENCYQGAWDSLEDYAENFLKDTGALHEVPAALRQYIDFQSYARDLELGGDIWSTLIDGKIHVFSEY